MIKGVTTSTKNSSSIMRLAVGAILGLGSLGLGCHRKTAVTQPSDPHQLVIVKATWGAIDGEPVEDKTILVAGMVQGNTLDMDATSRLLGDPAPFKVKELRVEYAKGGIAARKRLQEGGHLSIPADEKPAPVRLVVTKAIYGDLASGAVADVTQKVVDLVNDNTLSITPTNPLLGDPAPFKEKQLRVEFTFDGKAKNKVVAEKETLTISSDGQ